jgi:hypothetical protein
MSFGSSAVPSGLEAGGTRSRAPFVGAVAACIVIAEVLRLLRIPANLSRSSTST